MVPTVVEAEKGEEEGEGEEGRLGRDTKDGVRTRPKGVYRLGAGVSGPRDVYERVGRRGGNREGERAGGVKPARDQDAEREHRAADDDGRGRRSAKAEPAASIHPHVRCATSQFPCARAWDLPWLTCRYVIKVLSDRLLKVGLGGGIGVRAIRSTPETAPDYRIDYSVISVPVAT